MLDLSLYLSLFTTAFISATLIPIPSEALLIYMIASNYDPSATIIIATIGNTLGALTTVALAWYGSDFMLDNFFAKNKDKAKAIALKFKRYGALMAFFTFLPLIGDVLALALGFAHYNVAKLTFFVTLGKFLRYSLLALLFEYSIFDFARELFNRLWQMF